MSPKQQDALLHSALTFLAGLLAVALTWFIGAATSHPISIPYLLSVLPALLVALAVYVLHQIQPDTATKQFPQQPPPPPGGGR